MYVCVCVWGGGDYHRRTGPVHLGVGAHTFLVRFARIMNPLPESPPALKTSRGGGGGGARALFFFNRARNLFYILVSD